MIDLRGKRLTIYKLGTRLVYRLLLKEMESVKIVQIMDVAVYDLFHANAFGKGMNPSVLPQAMV